MERIDLHTHSHHSDGTQSVYALVREAAQEGLTAIALTDHDTTDGWDEAREAAGMDGIAVIPGIEVTCQRGEVSVHILAYLVNPSPTTRLARMIASTRDARDMRARRIVERLSADYPITWEDVAAQVAGEDTVVGRPHIADALVAAGVLQNRSQAFESILAKGSPYYIPTSSMDPLEAIAAIHEAGGVSVVAHGLAKTRRGSLSLDEIEELCAAGLDGLEVAHREHDSVSRTRLAALATAYDAVITGGSDYHGAGKPNRLGENTTAPAQFRALHERALSEVEVFGT